MLTKIENVAEPKVYNNTNDSHNVEEQPESPAPYADYASDIVKKGLLLGQLPIVTTHPNLLEAQAKQVMEKKGFGYIRCSAGEAGTMEANRIAFKEWRIIPRILRPTTPRDLSTTLFGHNYNVPILMAPVGIQAWYHEEKEVGTARACDALGVPFCMSTAAASSIEEIAAANQGPKWFQLYWPQDDEITASILGRAKANGFQALVVTLDAWTLAWRPDDLDNAAVPFPVGEGDEVGFSDPVFRRKFAERSDGDTPEDNPIAAAAYWVSEVFPAVSRGWKDIAILRKYWDGPIILKGILCAEDAVLAVENGLDGIVVSNHGGRQIDGSVASLEVLPEIVDAVAGRLTVMLDSGVRTGADIFKALALGASGVFVGRPVVYGLGINGKEGAEAVLAGLLADLDLTMGFAGVRCVSELNRSMLRKSRKIGAKLANL